MLFNSFAFAGFFVVVYGLYLLCARRLVLQNALLLLASYFFYGCWDWRFLGLIWVSTIIDYLCGKALDRRGDVRLGETIPPPSLRSGGALGDPVRESDVHGLPIADWRGTESAIDNRQSSIDSLRSSIDNLQSTISNPRSPISNRQSTIDNRQDRYVRSPRSRKAILLFSVAANLGILGFFKYFDFFAGSAASLLSAIGLPLETRLLNLVLPVGISFYTFQTLSYTIDVYRGRIGAHKSLLDFAVFVAFFPQLVAGPIVRAREFLPQVSRPRRLNLKQVYEGGYLILWGLFKKVVIADNLAILVDQIFLTDSMHPEAGGRYLLGGAVLVALYAFALQIYCDFSAYSDIARGCAKMMGFDIRLNFNLPYFASNPAEFWRRWHISLSTWLRDYVYIPLGGNRKGPRRTCINLALTMVLGGLWHGAAWTFVLWGVYQGVLLIVHRALMPWINRAAEFWPRRYRGAGHWIAVFGFFHLVCFGWLIFRAESVEQVGRMLQALGTPWLWWLIAGANTLAGTGVWTLLGFAAPLMVMQIAQQRRGDLNVLLRTPAFVRGLAYVVMFYGLVFYEGGLHREFIYFQF